MTTTGTTSSTLTAKQQRFVQEYMVDLNATQAAVRAGYALPSAPMIGCTNLMKPNIATALQSAQAEQGERTRINAEWVQARLVENIERAMQAVEVIDRHGLPTGTYVYQGNVANQALSLLAKRTGGFSEDVGAGTASLSLEDGSGRAVTFTLNIGRPGLEEGDESA